MEPPLKILNVCAWNTRVRLALDRNFPPACKHVEWSVLHQGRTVSRGLGVYTDVSYKRRRICALGALTKVGYLYKAAFENVSMLTLPSFASNLAIIDIRKARLPPGNPPPNAPLNNFDPRKHREPQKPISPAMAHFMILRSLCSAGMLGLPLAVSQAGIVLGPMLCMIMGGLIIHTHLMLLECLNEISRQLQIPYVSYRYGFRIALLHGPQVLSRFGEYGPEALVLPIIVRLSKPVQTGQDSSNTMAVIAVFMVLSQLGICTVIVILSADSLRDMMDWDNFTPALLCLFLPYALLQFFMKNLKIVSYVTMAANLLGLVGIILIFYLIFADPHGEIDATTSGPSLLFAIGTFFFNLSHVGVMLSLDKSLLRPEILVSANGPIVVGISVSVAVCTIYGTLGYWSFGTMEDNVLRSLPYDDMVTMVIFGLYLVAIAFTYPLQSYPGVQIVLEVIKNQDFAEPLADETLKNLEYIGRPIFVVLTFVISYLVPFQAPFVAFVGNLCTTLLSLVFPAVMELCLMYPSNYGKYRIYLIKNLLLIILGTISWIFGVIFSIKIIYVRILSSRSPTFTYMK